jgi:hypothetical protein
MSTYILYVHTSKYTPILVPRKRHLYEYISDRGGCEESSWERRVSTDAEKLWYEQKLVE